MEEIKKKIQDSFELNENEGTLYPNLWDTIKAVLRGKHIVLSASKKKLERSYSSNLTAHLKGELLRKLIYNKNKQIHPRGVDGRK